MCIRDRTYRAWIYTEEGKRRTLQKNDIAACIANTDIFDFLIDIIPREEYNKIASIKKPPTDNFMPFNYPNPLGVSFPNLSFPSNPSLPLNPSFMNPSIMNSIGKNLMYPTNPPRNPASSQFSMPNSNFMYNMGAGGFPFPPGMNLDFSNPALSGLGALGNIGHDPNQNNNNNNRQDQLDKKQGGQAHRWFLDSFSWWTASGLFSFFSYRVLKYRQKKQIK
eukprot:TRINITY_DN9065_c0_g1_i11.p1 TRINITY_DN9065_c0_g1~~TRINITY_DN9065_c0_g1_i11.p1  ORF type:complete len:250 (+),score=59.45 TRINITY_DN9065_c0_g1_i11:88-750(+)